MQAALKSGKRQENRFFSGASRRNAALFDTLTLDFLPLEL
jgi:hypothetical protein